MAKSGERPRYRAELAAMTGAIMVAAFVLAWASGGSPSTRPRLLSGAAWLASSQVGQLTLLDGASAEVVAQVQVSPRGHRLDAVQEGATAYAVDHTAGSIQRIDGATYDLTGPVTPIPGAGDGLTAFAGNGSLYALDTRRGVLTTADPGTLADRGGMTSLAAQASPQAGSLDDDGRLWVLDGDSGDLIWLDGHGRHVRRGAVTPGAGLLTIADGSPVVVDTQQRTAAEVDPKSGQERRTPV